LKNSTFSNNFFYRGVNEKEAVWWWKETKETNVKDGRVV